MNEILEEWMLNNYENILKQVVVQRATSLFDKGKPIEAINTLEKHKLNDPKNPDIYNNLGVFYHSIGANDLAVEILQEGIGFDDNNYVLKSNLVDIFLDKDNTEKAIEILENVVSNTLNYDGALTKLLNLYLAKEDYPKIVDVYNAFNEGLEPSGKKNELLLLFAPYLEKIKNVIQKNPEVDVTDYEDIACPFCNETNAEVYRTSADIVRCKNCGVVYLRHRFTKEVMYRLYQTYADDGSHMSLPASQTEIKNSVLRRDYFLKEILEFVKPGGTLLDIGCGWGGFLDNARDKGFNPRGIEMTKKCVVYANDTLNIQVTNEQFEDTPFDAESISVITMNHVFEHLPYPQNALEKIHNVLVDDGIFAGIVPNIASYVSQNLTEKWYWLDPNYHYVHYSPDSLRRQLEKNGFKVERLYTQTGDYGQQNVIDVIKEKVADSSSVDYSSLLDQLEKNGMGEEIRFVARKIKTQNISE